MPPRWCIAPVYLPGEFKTGLCLPGRVKTGLCLPGVYRPGYASRVCIDQVMPPWVGMGEVYLPGWIWERCIPQGVVYLRVNIGGYTSGV